MLHRYLTDINQCPYTEVVLLCWISVNTGEIFHQQRLCNNFIFALTLVSENQYLSQKMSTTILKNYKIYKIKITYTDFFLSYVEKKTSFFISVSSFLFIRKIEDKIFQLMQMNRKFTDRIKEYFTMKTLGFEPQREPKLLNLNFTRELSVFVDYDFFLRFPITPTWLR